MDLDARVKELMDFKRRAEPMLAAYEKHLQETLGDGAAGTSFETGVTDQNRNAIYAANGADLDSVGKTVGVDRK
jgi:hypothetical protein